MKEKHAIDFNLAKHLEAIIENKSVSLAARAVGITQPAMSNSLAKIRDHFDDPIIVKTKTGYKLSSLGEKLAPKIKELMQSFDSTFLRKEEFDPETDEITFNIAVSDSAGYVFGPAFLQYFSINFPKIKLNFYPMEENHALEKLDNGEITLSIVSTLDNDLPQRLYSKLLRLDPFAVAGCFKVFGDKSSITFDEYINSSHYVVGPKGIDYNAVDKELNKIGFKRHVSNKLAHFSMGINSVMQTCNLITLPSSVLEQASQYGLVKAFQLPFEMSSVRHTMLWHEKYHKDRAHIWLRDKLSEVIKEAPGVF